MRNNLWMVLVSLLIVVNASGQEVIYLQCGHIFDVERGVFLENKTVIVEADTIKSVEDGILEPNIEGRTIDLTDHYVMPGLMDMHVHIENQTGPRRYIEKYTKNEADIAFDAVVFAKKTLMAGFTTVRDVGGTGVNIAIRDAINAGKVAGPRIYTSGKSIATTGGHADPTNGMKKSLMGDPGPREGVVNGPAEAAQAVRQRYKNGADMIKITATGGVLSVAKDGKRPQFSDEELEAIIRTASDYDMHTAAHAHGAEGMKRAVLAGITSIEHGTMMTEEVMDLMIEKGTCYVPTITAGMSVAEYAKIPGYYPALVVPKAQEIGPLIKETFGRAYKRGVHIVFGTDAGVFYHGENAKEFVYMVDEGMPMSECLRAATRSAAEMLGIYEEVGSIEVGKFADIIAVRVNPEENSEILQEVDFVMKNGYVHKLNGIQQAY